jgi:hypothetical protein
MLDLSALAERLDPSRTVLLLGAGVSVSSGAPTGAMLSNKLAARIGMTVEGADLSEIATIFESKFGRKPLIATIKAQFKDLQPSGSLIALASLNWPSIYSTNFDQLMEAAHREAHRDLHLVRSNFDFNGRLGLEGTTTLYKIHGCLSQDVALGHKASMVLTVRDYEDHENYRQALFRALQFEMMTKDTLVIGHSLRDPHLVQLAQTVARLHSEQGTPGRVYCLVYESDENRAILLEQRGLQVAFGSLEEFVEHRLSRSPIALDDEGPGEISDPVLSPRLHARTIDIRAAANHQPNARRMFNGSTASYADIASGYTIQRVAERQTAALLHADERVAVVVLGAAGVGKSTLARRLALTEGQHLDYVWEHNGDFPLDASEWLRVESALRAQGLRALLVIDEATSHLTAVNRLMDTLGEVEDPSLRLLLTANTSNWILRSKSPWFFRRGAEFRLSKLELPDLEAFVSLLDHQPEIHILVEREFAILGRDQQLKMLRDRCGADMYVCLKNIFAAERLDDILLREYADLGEGLKDVYRHVAVVQAMGGKVHRQLVLRLLNVDAGLLQSMLEMLEDVVIEHDIAPNIGLYGWRTRHSVIAEVIATYKFADESEHRSLLMALIGGLNPAVNIEIETARSMCTSSFGIQRLTSDAQQIELLQALIASVPGERIPRRRLIRKYLDLGRLEDADHELRNMKRDIGSDEVAARYEVILAIKRAEFTQGILEEDRVAMLKEAERLARQCVKRKPADKKTYRVLADVALALLRRTGDVALAVEVAEMARSAEDVVLDPELTDTRRMLEQQVSDAMKARGAPLALTAAVVDEEYG